MKTKRLAFSSLLAVAFLALVSKAAAQTKNENDTWYKKKQWLGGLNLQPSSTVNDQELARLYRSHKKYFDEAFAFLKNRDPRKLAPGKYPIDGDNVYATVTEDSTKDFSKSRWESHKKYTDLQYVISGEEKIGVDPGAAGLTVTEPYNGDKDVAHYSGPGKIYIARPGTFFLFFPGTAHRPNITMNNNKPDLKIVIKIRSD